MISMLQEGKQRLGRKQPFLEGGHTKKESKKKVNQEGEGGISEKRVGGSNAGQK